MSPPFTGERRAPLWAALVARLNQAKKKNPNANPNDVRRICLELIEKM